MPPELQFHYDTLEDIPEEHRDFYVEHGDRFQLNVLGAVPASERDTFRKQSVQYEMRAKRLQQELDDLRQQHEELDRKLQDSQDKSLRDKDNQPIDPKQLEEYKADAIKRVADDRDRGFKARDEEIAALKQELRELKITTKLQKAATDAKIESWAIQDAVTLGERVFDLDENQNVFAYETDPITKTRQMRYDADGNPLTIETWLKEQIAQRAGWLPASSGGGAHHQGNGTNGQRTPQIDPNLSPAERLTQARKARAAPVREG